VGQGDVGWFTQGVINNMAVCGFGCENPSVVLFQVQMDLKNSLLTFMHCSRLIH